jgi:hypothetical protein
VLALSYGLAHVGLCDFRFFNRYKRPDFVRLGTADLSLAAAAGSHGQEYEKEWDK